MFSKQFPSNDIFSANLTVPVYAGTNIYAASGSVVVVLLEWQT